MVLYNDVHSDSARHPGPNAALNEVELAGLDLRVLESCHSIWFLDPARMRFRRVPRGSTLDISSGEWTPYHRLEVDTSGWFVVTLNGDSTRMLRSWLHVEPCPHCQSEDRTEELPISPPRSAPASEP